MDNILHIFDKTAFTQKAVFRGNLQIYEVIFHDDISEIPAEAFAFCKNLKRVILSDKIKIINKSNKMIC